MSWLSAALIVLLVAAPASADKKDTRENKARQAYESGFAASEAKDYATALKHYQRSYSLMPRPRTMYNIALCEDELGQGNEAVEHFYEFLRTATDRDKEFRALAAGKIADLKRKYYGALTVKSHPSKSQVFIDGGTKGEGRTPLELSLPPGSHEITVVAKGSRPVVRGIEVVAGKRTTEFFRLGKATLNLVVTPKEASVELERHPGVAQKHLDHEMEPGEYRFRISSPGYRTQSVELSLSPDTKLERHVSLDLLASGALVVQSYRAGAAVSIDGQVLGLTQHSEQHEDASLVANVAAGEHLLIIELGSTTLQRRVHTSPGEYVTVSIKPKQTSVVRSKGFLWTLAGVGAASVAIGGGLGLHSLVRGGSDDPMEQDSARTQALVGDLLVLGGSGALLGAWALKGERGNTLEVSRALVPTRGSEADAQ